MSFDFSTTTHGKWILAGEHAVLRGASAIVYPLKNFKMNLSYQATDQIAETHFSGEGEDWHVVIHGVLEKACALTNRSITSLTGNFHIHNEVPLGVGLGGSAALCVAVARWVHWQGWINQDDLLEFARQLENLFHRDSSGIDIVGANADGGQLYHRDGRTTPLIQSWHPQWYLSYSQQIGVTSQAVKQVQDLQVSNPSLAHEIDIQMQAAVEQAQAALKTDETLGMATLIKAINQAKICFNRWGLADGKVASHIQQLTDAGAIACKPTGSGNGGYVLSLWTTAPEHTNLDLLPV